MVDGFTVTPVTVAGGLVKVASTVAALAGIKKVVLELVALVKVTPGLDVVQVSKTIPAGAVPALIATVAPAG